MTAWSPNMRSISDLSRVTPQGAGDEGVGSSPTRPGPRIFLKARVPNPKRLLTKFAVGDQCWEWHGSKDPAGYGRIRSGDKILKAHRAVYELLVGSIPEGLELDHLCRNRSCVSPAHLEPVTRAENNRRTRGHRPIKTHCPKGHPYNEANTLVRKNRPDSRECRACQSLRRERRKATAKAAKRTLYDHDAASLAALALVVAGVTSPPHPRRLSRRADQPTPVGLVTTP